MLFIPLLILAIILYVIGHRVSSVLIFFFFCLNGFQIVPYPDVLFNTHLGISKPTDFAFLYVLFLCFYGLNRYRDFLPRNLLTRLIGYYTLLLLVLMGISLFYYHVPASEVVRTIRPYFLVYAYFPLRRLTYEQYNKVVYALWIITLVQSVLFVLQAATKLPFLADQYGGGPGDFIFYRYYNYPKLLYLAAYLSIFGGYPFHSPLLRKVGIALFSFVVYLTFSRAALAEYLLPEERIITIEDSAELQFSHVDNLVRMETRNANTEGDHAVTMNDLIKASLRMRPTRIIVGEVRGEEAGALLNAASTGHSGSLSTIHGNSCRDALRRLETMVLMGMELPLQAIRRQIASGIDLIVYLGRLRDKSRRLLEITEVAGMEGEQVAFNPLFSFRETGESSGRVAGVQERIGEMKNIEKFLRAGMEAG